MDEIINNLIIGLVISLIGGLFFIAYKHPKVYKKYHNLLYALNLIFFIFFSIHLQTKRNCLSTLMFKYPNDKTISILIKDLDKYSNFNFIAFFSISSLLIFLSFLKSMIDKAEKQEPK